MYHVSHDNQEGVTLLMAVLIMSTLAIISAAVAFFAVQEIRSSRAVMMSEPAILAAGTGAEQGLWALKRSGTLNTCPTISIVNLSNNSQVNLCKSYAAATFYLKANVATTFYLYDPNNVNGDVDLSGFPYTWLQVTHQAGGFSIAIVVIRLDGNYVANTSVSPNSSNTINIPAVPPGSEARMRVILTSTGDATALVTTNQGMPTYPTIDASGCTANGSITNCSSLSNLEGFVRRLNISIPP